MINRNVMILLSLICITLLVNSCSIDPFIINIDLKAPEYIGKDNIMEIDKKVEEIDSTHTCPITFLIKNYEIDYVEELNIKRVTLSYDFVGFSPNGSVMTNIDIYLAEDSLGLYRNEPAIAFNFPIIAGETTYVKDDVSIDPSLLDLFSKRKFAMGFCHSLEKVEAQGDSIQGSIWAQKALLIIEGSVYIKP